MHTTANPKSVFSLGKTPVVVTATMTQAQFASGLAAHFIDIEGPNNGRSIMSQNTAHNITELYFHPERNRVTFTSDDQALVEIAFEPHTYTHLQEMYDECGKDADRTDREPVILSLVPVGVTHGFGF